MRGVELYRRKERVVDISLDKYAPPFVAMGGARHLVIFMLSDLFGV